MISANLRDEEHRRFYQEGFDICKPFNIIFKKHV
jgi:hypothetical protein